jgi:hypothetical protein
MIERIIHDYWGLLGAKVLAAFVEVVRVLVSQDGFAMEKISSVPYANSELNFFLGAERQNISLFGFNSAAEWRCVVSCLKWLISILGDPQGDAKIHRCNMVYGTPSNIRPIWNYLRRSLPQFQETQFELEYVVRAEQIPKPLSPPHLVAMLVPGYIGVHTDHHFNYSKFSDTEEWKGEGLKIPYSLLIHETHSRGEVDGFPILHGCRDALVPITRFEDGSIQWVLLVTAKSKDPYWWYSQCLRVLQLFQDPTLRWIQADNLKGDAYVCRWDQ